MPKPGAQGQVPHWRDQAGSGILLRHGHHGVLELAKVGLPIFLDLKLHDIPNTVAGAMQAIHVLQPSIVTIHAAGASP
jgi:orotidine-5'-phosphate decarboxylase